MPFVSYSQQNKTNAQIKKRKSTNITPALEYIKDTSSLILKIMQQQHDKFQYYIDNAKDFEIQIIYTQVNRNELNKPSFKQYSFRLDENSYFYPASLVKLPLACLTLEKLNNLNIKGLNKNTFLKIDSVRKSQSTVILDTTAEYNKPMLANYIKKMFLVSDNDAYNRVYEFCGQRHINQRLWQMGFTKSMIIQRFAATNYEENKYTNPFTFYDKRNNKIYEQNPQFNPDNYINPLGVVKKGRGYVIGKRFINEPKDFTYSNTLPLQYVHDMLLGLVFPENFSKSKRFNLTEDDRNFLLRYLGLYPRESNYPSYPDFERYPDNYKKYLIFGDSARCLEDSTIRIFNIVGQSYGYIADCGYFVDFKNKIEFFLGAVIFCNKDKVYNYSRTEAINIGFPFMANLGKTIYQYELNRKRKILPDLSKIEKIVK